MFAVVGCVLRDDTKEVIVVKDKHRSVGRPTPLEGSGGVSSKNTHYISERLPVYLNVFAGHESKKIKKIQNVKVN